jgi:hypothetical protein
MGDLYYIVHEKLVFDKDALNEIRRIKEGEEYMTAESAGPVPPGIPKVKKIKVCGAYAELCVPVQCKSFRDDGYDAEVHWPGTQRFKV